MITLRGALLPIACAVALLSSHLHGQETGANTVLTGIQGLPWGSTREQWEAKFGAADSVHTRGDTVNLVYVNQSFLRQQATHMDVLVAPGGGVTSVAYLFQRTPGDCLVTFGKAVAAVSAEYPGLRPTEPDILIEGTPAADSAQACRQFASRPQARLVAAQTLRDPTGPGSVWLFTTVSSRGMILVIDLKAAQRPRR